MSNEIVKKEPVADVVSHEVTPLPVKTDAASFAKFGWLVVAFGVGGFLLWASLAPLDKGVPMGGTVTKETNRKTLQHQGGGMVKDILVKDGDVVKAGQVLIRMNDIIASSQLETTRAQYFAARASEARLMAERDNLPKLVFPASLENFKSDPRVTSNIELQGQLMNARRQALGSELSVMEESIAGLKSQIKGLEESRNSKKAQMAFLKEQLDGMRDLSKEGYVARNRLLDLERTFAQLNGAISEDIGNIGKAQRQVMELTLRRVQRQQEYAKEVRSTLVDVQREAEALAGRISGQEFEVASTEIKAPVDGVVVGLNVFTRGGVVGSGQRLLEIVPTDDPLAVEGQLAVNLIDKVHPGLPVELIFSAFNANRTPHIPGVVTQVSADRTVDERTGQPYYKVRAKVSPEGAKIIASKKMDIQPGMPVEMFVKTGERTMMSYLLKPITDRAKTSLSED